MDRPRPPGFARALVLGAGVALLLGLFLGWWGAPRLLAVNLTQPVRFSHKVHVRQDVACPVCHFTGPGGTFSGFPATLVCAGCHPDSTGGASADEKEIDKLVREYVKKGKEVAWMASQRQPEHVRFPHGPHLPLGCPSCHPDMRREDSLTVVRNPISGYTLQAMPMARCRACHQERGAAGDCMACHR